MKKLIFFFVLFCTLSINAQTPVCTVNTTGWKKIPTIPVDTQKFNLGCKISYSTGSDIIIWMDTCMNDLKKHYDPKLNKVLDLTKYNRIKILYGFKACDMKLNYSLYKDKSGQDILIVNLFVPEVRCKGTSDVSASFLVLKKYCRNKPKVCILQHLLNNN